MTIKLSLLLTVLTALGLETHAQNDSTFVIKGVIDTVPHAVYVVRYTQKGNEILDTLTLDAKNEFEYRGMITEPTHFSLGIENNFNPNLVGDQQIYSFWAEPGKTLLFEGKTGWLVNGQFGLVARDKEFELKNSKTEEIEQAYNLYRKSTIAALRNDAKRLSGGKTLTEISYSIRNDYIKRNTDDFYSLYLLYTVTRFPKKGSFDFAKEVLPRFPDCLRSTYLGKEIQRRILVDSLTGIGSTMLDFEQADTSSNPVKLSDFRGKYVLIDFWASWCGPCRREHPFLLEVYENFASQGFEILSVSLDTSKGRWKDAIAADSLVWTQVSDLKGMDNAVAKRLFIHSIPDNFLIDPNGVIVARGLRGRELMRELAGIFDDQ